MALTKRQFRVLAFLDSFVRRNGYCPSYDEVRKALGLASLATVHKHMNTLQQKGYIRRDPNRSRSIEVIDRSPMIEADALSGKGENDLGPMYRAESLPLLGRIAAGRPVEAFANREALSLQEFVGNRNVYVLQVKGDSMIEDHICDGDFVVVESTNRADNGDTVVALVEGNEATLKRFYRDRDGRLRLQPANSSMAPIYMEQGELEIQGRVIGVLRKY
ncbi:MAG: transcriptional repressor LexA [Acidobacteria bacterium]|nr:transcriptional repressor LexA [Acidobacteriota bacterium]MYC83477.1 transcriptional repressor LexA [Acidobacteriota bacterium]